MTGELSTVPSSAVQRPVGTIRSPIGGWLLVYVTLGIYILFVPIVGFVSIYNTGGRMKQAQSLARVLPTTSAA